MSKQTSNSLFALSDFRPYVQSWAKVKGRGEFRRISSNLKMHTTLVSQILNGRKCFTEEQASLLASYMGLSALETDYFVKLVQFERAGTENLKKLYKRHLDQIRKQANEIKSRVPESKELTEQDRAIFYSSWQYALVRLLTDVEDYQTIEGISARLNLSISRTQDILDFLVARGLCEFERGRYKRTKKNTHIEASSSLSVRHHQNWRNKAIELQDKMTADDLAFSAAISISKADSEKVRNILLSAITEISKVVEVSKPEQFVYLGFDWIKL